MEDASGSQETDEVELSQSQQTDAPSGTSSQQDLSSSEDAVRRAVTSAQSDRFRQCRSDEAGIKQPVVHQIDEFVADDLRLSDAQKSNEQSQTVHQTHELVGIAASSEMSSSLPAVSAASTVAISESCGLLKCEESGNKSSLPNPAVVDSDSTAAPQDLSPAELSVLDARDGVSASEQLKASVSDANVQLTSDGQGVVQDVSVAEENGNSPNTNIGDKGGPSVSMTNVVLSSGTSETVKVNLDPPERGSTSIVNYSISINDEIDSPLQEFSQTAGTVNTDGIVAERRLPGIGSAEELPSDGLSCGPSVEEEGLSVQDSGPSTVRAGGSAADTVADLLDLGAVRCVSSDVGAGALPFTDNGGQTRSAGLLKESSGHKCGASSVTNDHTSLVNAANPSQLSAGPDPDDKPVRGAGIECFHEAANPPLTSRTLVTNVSSATCTTKQTVELASESTTAAVLGSRSADETSGLISAVADRKPEDAVTQDSCQSQGSSEASSASSSACFVSKTPQLDTLVQATCSVSSVLTGSSDSSLVIGTVDGGSVNKIALNQLNCFPSEGVSCSPAADQLIGSPASSGAVQQRPTGVTWPLSTVHCYGPMAGAADKSETVQASSSTEEDAAGAVGDQFVCPSMPDLTAVPSRSNLKRRRSSEDTDADDGGGPSKRPRRCIRFDAVTVIYFPRAQGFTCIPSQGGSTLGMAKQHSHVERYSIGDYAGVQRQAHRRLLARLRSKQRALQPATSSEESDAASEEASSDLSDSELDIDSCYFLRPVSTRQRRVMLRTSGVRKIEPVEREDCRNIRSSREFCGCVCKVVCLPETCLCANARIKCQVDRQNFPCGCTRDGCQNPSGRVEFNPARVRSHYIETILREQQRQRWTAAGTGGSSAAACDWQQLPAQQPVSSSCLLYNEASSCSENSDDASSNDSSSEPGGQQPAATALLPTGYPLPQHPHTQSHYSAFSFEGGLQGYPSSADWPQTPFSAGHQRPYPPQLQSHQQLYNAGYGHHQTGMDGYHSQPRAPAYHGYHPLLSAQQLQPPTAPVQYAGVTAGPYSAQQETPQQQQYNTAGYMVATAAPTVLQTTPSCSSYTDLSGVPSAVGPTAAPVATAAPPTAAVENTPPSSEDSGVDVDECACAAVNGAAAAAERSTDETIGELIKKSMVESVSA